MGIQNRKKCGLGGKGPFLFFLPFHNKHIENLCSTSTGRYREVQGG
jgi:hypothetical protein